MWLQVASYAGRAFPNAGHAFVDTHMMMIAAAAGDRAALESRLSSLDELVNKGAAAAGAVVPAIGRAFLAFAEENYRRCADILEPFADAVVRVGGSGAQREVIEDTLLIAWMRAGNTHKAKALLERRLHRRPSLRDERWASRLLV